MTIDNLCVMYGGCHGVGAGTVRDLTVQNCEFGWIGGGIQFIRDGRTTRFGNAVEIWGGCENYRVTDCYIYQIYDAGITQQYRLSGLQVSTGAVIHQRNMTYARNVIEACNYCIEYFLDGVSEDNPSRMENFLIEDNEMRYAGTGFCTQRPDHGQGAFIKGWYHSNRAYHYVIRNNRMVQSDDLMLHIWSERLNPDGSDSMPRLSGNVIVNHLGSVFGCCSREKRDRIPYDQAVIAYLGDKTSSDTFAFLPPKIANQN